MQEKRFISTTELAVLMGVSRVAVFNKIKKGEIRAQKIGRNFVIDKNDLPAELILENLQDANKEEIKRVVKKTVKEYGETLRLLGKE